MCKNSVHKKQAENVNNTKRKILTIKKSSSRLRRAHTAQMMLRNVYDNTPCSSPDKSPPERSDVEYNKSLTIM